MRFFAKRLFPRDLCFGLYSVGFRVARLVVRPLSCRLPCRVTRGSAFFLSAFVSRDSWLGFFPVGFRVAWLVARPLFCRLPCRATCGSGFFLSASVSRGLWLGLYSVGFRVARLVARVLCHWAVVIAGATAFATAALVALFIAGAALWIYNTILTRLIGRKQLPPECAQGAGICSGTLRLFISNQRPRSSRATALVRSNESVSSSVRQYMPPFKPFSLI